MGPASRLEVLVVICLVAAAYLAAGGVSAAEGAAKTLAVEAGPSARANVPMSVPLPQGTAQAKMTDG